MESVSTNEAYQNLAAAIVASAYEEYIKTRGHSQSVERFLESDWYGELTDVPPDAFRAMAKRDILYFNRAAKIGAIHKKLGKKLYNKYVNDGIVSFKKGTYDRERRWYRDYIIEKED